MMGMISMPVQKPANFRGSFRRLLGRLAPERALVALVIVLAIVSVAFAVIGPKILGNATNDIFNGVISQQLIPRADGKGRALALEILTNTPAVANVIREARTYMLPGIIQTGKKQGMQLMDDALAQLHKGGLISAEEAYARADQKQEMKERLKI